MALGTRQEPMLCSTWGGIAEVTYPFLAHYLDESWAVISEIPMEAGGGPRLDCHAAGRP